MRVSVDLTKPLRRGTILKGEDGSVYRVFCKFERLLDFCYSCGKPGHLLKDCNEKENDEGWDGSNLKYGPCMRASPMRSRLVQEEGRIGSPQMMFFKPEENQERTKQGSQNL